MGAATAHPPLVLPHSFRQHRLLVLAPHPDDESLATGGLIQRAVKQGGEVRVVFISDGENNPWPQRVLERRWVIGKHERERWGGRRRSEALAALQRLGVPEAHAQFLGWPDQGMTSMLLRGEKVPVHELRELLKSWRPTIVVSPSPHDLHPDHNALAVLLSVATSQLPEGMAMQHFHYIVHGRPSDFPRPCCTLHLSTEERLVKHQAILEHQTQMALSRKRFLAYARGCERFHPAGAFDPAQRIRHAAIEGGALCVWIQRARGLEKNGELIAAVESDRHGSLRWRVPIQRHPGVARLHDVIQSRPLRHISMRRAGGLLQIRLPISSALPVRRIALKLQRPTLFYDAAGWYEVPLPSKHLLSCSEISPLATPSFSSSFAHSSFGGVSEVSA